jgi:enoyl-CoA hydratase/carnithine racemase
MSATSPSSNGRGSKAWAGSWTHFRVDRRSPGFCRVTFDHPPINTITATTVSELSELVDLIEQDADLNVVVFDSANPGFYLADHEGVARPAWLYLLARLPRAPVVSIASIRGRVGGAGSEFVMACDLRFASRENGGHIDRVIADDRLDDEVAAIAWRLTHFDRDAIARTKSHADRAALLGDIATGPRGEHR